MMDCTVENMRRMGGLDPDVVSDEEAQGWIDAAKDWYADAGVPVDTPCRSYGHNVLNLACWLYDHKGSGEDVPQYFVLSTHAMRPKAVTPGG